MGRKKNSRNHKKPKVDETNQDKVNTTYDSYNIEYKNEKFEKFYRLNEIVPDEEFEEFYEILKTKLPVSFRLSAPSTALCNEMREQLYKKHFPTLGNVSPLTWFPGDLAYQVQVSAVGIRKSPEHKQFHQYLVAETDVGNICRQEAVSMIPPLFLDLKPEHRVLDMCASPGSKTTQILQLMHQQCPEGFPDGMVVANDADHKRAYLLVHQAKRMLSPMLLVTNHDGTQFPTLNDNDKNPILFDRVLCDVPCSGDGTLRKNMAMWRKWTPSVGIGLHPLQLRLLQRGCELTRIGGRIVYSTCSFNPAENEAVVAEILRLYPESLKLLDGFTLKHKDLKARPGLKTWKIMDTQGDVYDSYDQVPSKYVKWKKSIFPPTEEENIPLERCMRFLPHDQNTGGFFVAVFEKIGNMKEICKATEEMKKEKDELKECQEMLNSLESDSKDQGDKCEISNTDAVILEPQRPSNGYREEPFVFLSNQSYLDSVKSFYGFSESFPFSNFVIRNDKVDCIPNSIYFVSNKVREYLESRQAKKLCVINTGVKTFSRHDGPADDVRLCPFRFHQEALYSISPFISHRSMKIDMADAKLILSKEKTRFHELSRSYGLEDIPTGSMILCAEDFKFLVWKGRNLINVMINKRERNSLFILLENK